MTGAQNFVKRTASQQETEALGRSLGQLVRPGDLIALSGDLGAGKTVLARGIAQGAGAAGYFASPTFTLVREYRGLVPIAHIDLYRLDGQRQIEDIGFDEIVDQGGAVIIEWAEKIRSLLPPDYLWVELRFTDRENEREIEFTPRGQRYEDLLANLPKLHNLPNPHN